MTGQAPAVSVVVPAYDVEATIASTLQSVLRQTRPDFEVVVVDDGSADGTARVVETFTDERIRLVRQANRGLPGARNTGIAAATAGVIAFLDSDDVWMPRYLERMLGALAADPSAALAYADAWVFETGTGRVRAKTVFQRRRPAGELPAAPDAFLLVHLRDNFMHPSATVVRRDALEAVGGFREELTSLEDYELWLRLEAEGHRVLEVAEPLVLVRKSPTQMSANGERMNVNLLRVCDLLAERGDLPPAACDLLAARRRQAEETVHGLRRPWSPPALRRRVRRRLGEVAHALPPWQVWCERPPEEVAAAFGDLSRL